MSTIMFAEYAKFINGKLHTCDISKKNMENAKNLHLISKLRKCH